ncbi:hypothetical protein V2V09_09295 [Streptococcus agalactiae]
MTKKRILGFTLSLACTGFILATTVSSDTHTKVYQTRVKQLMTFDGFYKNSDGSVGGEFELVTGETVRVAKVDEQGIVYVYNTDDTYKKNKTYYILDNQSIDGYAKRVKDGGSDDRFN